MTTAVHSFLRRLTTAITLAAACGALITAADAREIKVTDNGNASIQPVVAVDTARNVHVVWVDFRSTAGGEVYYAMFDRDGTRRIDETRLSDADQAVGYPCVIAGPDGTVRVLWHQESAVTGRYEIMYTRIDPAADDRNGDAANDGLLEVVGDVMVSQDDSRTSMFTDAVIDGEGNLHLVWWERDWQEIKYLKIDAAGTEVVPEEVVYTNMNISSSYNQPALAVDGDGNAHIVFFDHNMTCADEVVYMMVDGSDGSILIDASVVSVNDCNQTARPDVAVDDGGLVHIVYKDMEPNWWVPEIMYTVIDPSLAARDGDSLDIDGITVVPDVMLSQDDHIDSNIPRIGINNGTVYVAWLEAGGTSGGSTGWFSLVTVDENGDVERPQMSLNSQQTLVGYSAPFHAPAFALVNPVVAAWCDFRDGNYEVYLNLDMDAPGRITDPAVAGAADNAVTIGFTAPGSASGAGRAYRYHAYYHAAADTSRWSRIWTGTALPAVYGDPDFITIDGLSDSTRYFFKIAAEDSAGNVAELSDAVSAWTRNDDTPPGTVDDLTIIAGAPGTVQLVWTAPGDDSSSGTAASYDVRYATAPITPVSWAIATQVAGEQTPDPAGSQDGVVVSGLQEGFLYYFAMKTADEQGNVSALSNVAFDSTAPNAVTDLAVVSISSNTATLQWSAPGDDAWSGTAASYDIRYHTSPITAFNWAVATRCTVDVPSPQAAGNTDSYQVTNLDMLGTEYYFALKTYDKALNLSGLSNVAGVPDIYTDPAGFSVVLDEGDTTSRTLTIGNTGNVSLNVWISEGAGWLSVSPSFVSVPAKDSVDILIRYDATGIAAAMYSVTAVLSTNDPDENTVNVVCNLDVVDVDPPARVTDLFLNDRHYTSFDLSWTAPGDNDTVGTASFYDIRYSSSLITDANWDAATPVTVGISPGTAGTAESYTAGNLIANSVIYMALRTADEGSLWSQVSNNVYDTVAAPVLSVAPDTLRASVSIGDSADAEVYISNTGFDTLIFSVGGGMAEAVRETSEIEFFVDAARTDHGFAIHAAAALFDSGYIECGVRGDYASTSENTSVYVEGEYMGMVGYTGADCSGERYLLTIPLTQQRYEDWIADDDSLEVYLQNTSAVNAFCTFDDHRVVVHIDHRAWSAGADTVLPGRTDTVSVRVGGPDVAGIHADTAFIYSNDPAAGAVELPVLVTVLDSLQPEIDVTPAAFSPQVQEAGSSAVTLVIANTGDDTLRYQTSFRCADGDAVSGEDIRVAVYNDANSVAALLNAADGITATAVGTYDAASLAAFDVLLNLRGSNLNPSDVLAFIADGGGWVGELSSNAYPFSGYWNAITGNVTTGYSSTSSGSIINDPDHYLATAVNWAGLPYGSNPCQYMLDMRAVTDPGAHTVVSVAHTAFGTNPLIIEKEYGEGRIVTLNWDWRDDPDYNGYVTEMFTEVVRYAGMRARAIARVSADSGMVVPGTSDTLSLTFYTGSLEQDTTLYDTLVIASNDADEGILEIPLAMSVVDTVNPLMTVSPSAVERGLREDDTVYENIVIANGGNDTLRYTVSFSAVPDTHRYAYSCNTDASTVSVIDLHTRAVVTTVATGSAPVACAVTPDGRYVYVANRDAGTVSVISTASMAVVQTVSVGSYPFDVKITPGGEYAYVVNRNSYSVSVIRTADNTVVKTISGSMTYPTCIAMAPDGRYAYVGNRNQSSITVIDLETQSVTGIRTVYTTYAADIAVTPDGSAVYVTHGQSSYLSIVDLAGGAYTTVSTGSRPHGVRFSPDGKMAYVVNIYGYSVQVIDVATQQTVDTFDGFHYRPRSVAVSPDGAYLYVTILNTSSNIAVIDAASGEWVRVLDVGSNPRGIEALPLADTHPAWAVADRVTGKVAPGAVDTLGLELAQAWMPAAAAACTLNVNGNDETNPVAGVYVHAALTDTLQPELALVPAVLADTAEAGDTVSTALVVGNSGNYSLNYVLSVGDGSWCSAVPVSGSVASGSSDTITVTLAAVGLAGGMRYDDTLTFTTNDSDESVVTVPVALTVTDTASVTGLTLAEGDSVITLGWSTPRAAAFNRMIVRFDTLAVPADTASGTALMDSLAAPGTVLQLLHTGLNNGVRHYYTLFAAGAGGLLSQVSDSAVPADTVPPAPAAAVSVTPLAADTNRIAWVCPADDDAAGVAVYYRADTAYARDPSGSDGTLVLDTAAAPGDTVRFDHATAVGPLYYYTLFTYDEVPNYGTPVFAAPAGAPPEAPQGLTASAAGDTVHVVWNGTADTGVAYYVVYADTAASPADSIGRTDAPDTSFVHTGMGVYAPWYYRVKAVAGTGLASAFSVTDSAVPSDAAAPGTVTVLSAVSGAGSTVVSWTNPADADWSGSVLYARYDTVVYTGNFNDNATAGWSRTGDAGALWGAGSGMLSVTGTSAYSAFTVDALTVADFEVSCRWQYVSGTHMGITFRGQGAASDSCYQWIIRPDQQSSRIQKRTNSGLTQTYLVGGSGGIYLAKSLQGGTWYHLRLRVEGTYVQGWIDGLSVIAGDMGDTDFATGTVGFAGYDGTVYFDDFAVSAATSRTAAVDSTAGAGASVQAVYTGPANNTPVTYGVYAYDEVSNISDTAVLTGVRMADTLAGAVTGLGAGAYDSAVTLSWTNPSDADLAGALVVYRTDGVYPVISADAVDDFNDNNLRDGRPFTWQASGKWGCIAGELRATGSGFSGLYTGTGSGDGCVTVRLQRHEAAAGNLGLNLCYDPDEDAGIMVLMGADSSSGLFVYDAFDNQTLAVLPMATDDTTWYTLRAEVSGNTVRARLWRDGGTEPAAWMVETADNNINGIGRSGIVCTGSAGAAFDDFAVIAYTGTVTADTAGLVPGGNMSLARAGLHNGTEYRYTVAAYDDNGNVSSAANVTAVPADTVSPAVPVDFTAVPGTPSSGALAVTWTAVGDNGTAGTAAAYDIRYSTAPVTDSASWAAASPVVYGAPAAPGTPETLSIYGLDESTAYYVGITVSDESGNISALVLDTAATTADTAAPGAVTDLVSFVTPPDTGSDPHAVTLVWSAPGDDGNDGIATAYDIRYATAPIDSAGWITADTVAGGPVPAFPGTPETLVVTGLQAGTAYYFAVCALDEKDNMSPLSNIAADTTRALVFSDDTEWDMNVWDATGLWHIPDTVSAYAASSSPVRAWWYGSEASGTYATGSQNTGELVSPALTLTPGAFMRFARWEETDGEPGFDVREVYASTDNGSTWNPVYASAGDRQGTWVTETVDLDGYTGAVRIRFLFDSMDGFDNAHRGWYVDDVRIYTRTADVDVTAPAAPSAPAGIAATQTSVTVSWTAPGDDGSSGTAAAYDIRYATTPITSGNWDGALQLNGEPRPLAAGSVQQATIGGLVPNTTYYVAMKAADERLNISGLSGVATVATSDDTEPPADVTDLVAGSATDSSVSLAWTAPGDDGTSGYAYAYDLRYATDTITAATWGAATPCTGEGMPQEAGMIEDFTVDGLEGNRTYYFALTTADDSGNVSGLSNVAVRTTPADGNPPSPVTGFTSSSDDATVYLRWVNPGDQDFRKVMVRFNNGGGYPASATEGNLAFIDSSGARGDTVRDTITGLPNGVTYYFAAFAMDEIPNYAPAAYTAATPQDPFAPADADTFYTISSDTTVRLYWTMPGDADLEGLVIRYRTDGSYPVNWNDGLPVYDDTLTGPGGSDSLVLTGLTNGVTYRYRAWAYDEVPNYSVGVSASGAPQDVTAPDPVQAFTATAGDTVVTLAWQAPAGDDLTAVMVRWDTTGVPANGTAGFLAVSDSGALPGSTGTFIHDGLANGLTYYYAAFAIDERPNYSAASADSGVPSDVTAPSSVSGFMAAGGDSTVSVSWTTPADGDLAGVTVRWDTAGYPVHPDSGYLLVADSSAGNDSTVTVSHDSLGNGVVFYYSAFTYDEVPNYAAVAQDSALTRDLTPPDTASGFRAAAFMNADTLYWINPSNGDFKGVMLRYRTDGSYPLNTTEGAVAAIDTVTPAGSTAVFVHTGLENWLRYYYSIFSFDHAGNYSTISGLNLTAEATPYDTSAPPPPAATALAESGRVTVTWDSVAIGTFSSYAVFRSTDNAFNPDSVAVLATTAGTSYVDSTVTNDITYYYVVSQVDTLGKAGHSAKVTATPSAYPLTLSSVQVITDADNWDFSSSRNMTPVAPHTWALAETLAADDALWFSFVTGHSLAMQYGPGTQSAGDPVVLSGTADTSMGVFEAVIGRTGLFTYTFNDSSFAYTLTSAAPAAPQSLAAVAGDEEIFLAWNQVAAADLADYVVYRTTDSTWDSVNVDTAAFAAAGESTYTDTGLVNQITYYYVITARDSAGNEGVWSNGVSAMPVDTLAPSKVSDIWFEEGTDNVDLYWIVPADSVNADLAGVTVRYAFDRFPARIDSGMLLIADSVTAAGDTGSFSHSALETDTLVYYTIFTYDEAGNTAVDSVLAAPTTDMRLSPVSDTTGADHISLALDATGASHIVYGEFNTASTNLYYHMVGDGGAVLIDRTMLVAAGDSLQADQPTVTVDTADAVHVVYQYGPGNGNGMEVYYLAVDPSADDRDGSPASAAGIITAGPVLLSAADTVQSYAPSAARDREDNLHVTWWDEGDLHYAKLDNSGNVLIADKALLVNTGASTGGEKRCMLDFDSQNNMHLALFLTPNGDETYYMMLDDTAGVLIDTTMITVNDGMNSKMAKLLVDAYDKVHVFWHDNIGGGAVELYYQKLDPAQDDWNGNPASYAAISDIAPRALSGDGLMSKAPYAAMDQYRLSLHLAWFETKDFGGGWSGPVYYRQMDLGGNTFMADTSLAPGSGKDNAWRRPWLAVDANDKAHIAWIDDRWTFRDWSPHAFYEEIQGQTPPLPAPQALDAYIADDNVVGLEWEPVNHPLFSHYVLYRDTTAGFTPTAAESILATTDTSFLDSNVVNNRTFFYQVRTRSTLMSLSASSNEDSVTIVDDDRDAPSFSGFLPAAAYDTASFDISVVITDPSGVYDDGTGSGGQGAYILWDNDGELVLNANEIELSVLNGDTFVTDTPVPAQAVNAAFLYRAYAHDNDADAGNLLDRQQGISATQGLSITDDDTLAPVITNLTDAGTQAAFRIRVLVTDASGVYDDASGSAGQGAFVRWDADGDLVDYTEYTLYHVAGDTFATDSLVPAQDLGADFIYRAYAYDDDADNAYSGDRTRGNGATETFTVLDDDSEAPEFDVQTASTGEGTPFNIDVVITDASGIYDDSTGSTGYGVYLIWDTDGELTADANEQTMSAVSGNLYRTDNPLPAQSQGTAVVYRVYAWDNDRDLGLVSDMLKGSSDKHTITVTEATNRPDLTAVGVMGAVDLSWTAVAGTEQYTVYRSTVAGFTPAPGDSVGAAGGTSYGDSSVTDGITYYYRVNAVDSSGTAGPYSDERDATPGYDGNYGSVQLTGSFNAWTMDESANMTKTADHLWVRRLALPSATYQFKYVTGNDLAGNDYFGDNEAPSTGSDTLLYTGTADLSSNSNIQVQVPTPGMFDFFFNDSSLTYYVSTLAPVAVAGLTATGGTDLVRLAWDASSAPDVDYYIIYRDTVAGAAADSAALLADRIDTTTYTDTTVQNGVTYYYRVSAVDLDGNTGYYSAQATGTPGDETPPARITDLAASQPDTESITLQWTATGDDGAAGTAVLYDIRYNTEAVTDLNWDLSAHVIGEPVPQSAGQSEAMAVHNLAEKVTYHFAMKVKDDDGNWSSLSNGASETTLEADSILVVRAPGGVAATGSDGRIDLQWNTVAGAHGFVVYRSTQSGFTPVAGDSVAYETGTVYADTTVVNGTAYYYRVATMDTSGTRSGYSDQASAVPSAYVVSVPVQLSGSFNGWASDETANMLPAGTHLWQRTLSLAAVPVQFRFLTGNSTSAKVGDDDAPAAGTDSVLYTGTGDPGAEGVIAFIPERSGIFRIFYNDSTYAYEITTLAPARVTGLTVSAADGSLQLGWNAGTAADIDSYYVYRSTSAGFTPVAPVVSTGTNTYTDTDVVNGTAYRYVVTAVDRAGNEGYFSAEASGIPDDVTPPAAVVDLAAGVPSLSTIPLRWTATGDDGTSGTATAYDVRYHTSYIDSAAWYRAAEAAGEPAPAPAGSTESMTVGGLDANTTYYFAVRAVDNDGNYGVISNIASATTLDSSGSLTDPAALAAAGGAGGINLTWAPSNPPSALSHYVIYRGNVSGFVVSGADSVGISADTAAFADSGVVSGNVYYYRVAAVDTSGAKTGLTNQAQAVASDVEYNMVVLLSGGFNSWSEGTDAAMVPGTAHEWAAVETLTAAQHQFRFRYFMVQNPDSAGYFGEGQEPTADTGRTSTAVYGDADEGSISTIAFTVPAAGRYRFVFNDSTLAYRVERLGPLYPANITHSLADSSVSLSWDANTEANLSHYLVYRADEADLQSPTRVLLGQAVDASYLDTTTVYRDYYYWVTAVDSAGDQSRFSRMRSVSVTEAVQKIVGVVTRTDGVPVPGAVITVIGTGGDTAKTVNTNGDGSFDIRVQGGTYALRIVAPGYIAAGTTLVAQADPPAAAIMLSRLGDYDGRDSSDADIDYHDMLVFAAGWRNGDTAVCDLGPATGTAPALTATPDGVIDFYDVSVFAEMWRWSYGATGVLKAAERYASGTYGSGATVHSEPLGNGVYRITVTSQSPDLMSASVALGFDPSVIAITTGGIQPGNAFSGNRLFLAAENGSGALVNLARLDTDSAAGNGLVSFTAKAPAGGTLVVRYRTDDGAGSVTGGGMVTLMFPVDGTVPAWSVAAARNPFVPGTDITWTVATASRVTVAVMDAAGNTVRELAGGTMAAGSYAASWDGRDRNGVRLPEGVYVVVLDGAEGRYWTRIVLTQ